MLLPWVFDLALLRTFTSECFIWSNLTSSLFKLNSSSEVVYKRSVAPRRSFLARIHVLVTFTSRYEHSSLYDKSSYDMCTKTFKGMIIVLIQAHLTHTHGGTCFDGAHPTCAVRPFPHLLFCQSRGENVRLPVIGAPEWGAYSYHDDYATRCFTRWFVFFLVMNPCGQ